MAVRIPALVSPSKQHSFSSRCSGICHPVSPPMRVANIPFHSFRSLHRRRIFGCVPFHASVLPLPAQPKRFRRKQAPLQRRPQRISDVEHFRKRLRVPQKGMHESFFLEIAFASFSYITVHERPSLLLNRSSYLSHFCRTYGLMPYPSLSFLALSSHS